MVRLVRNGFLFLLVTAVLYAACMFALYHVHLNGSPLLYRTNDHYKGKGGVTYAKLREFDPTERYDVIVIGSSHAYRGYDPALFAQRGVRMYNLGTSAQSPLNTYFLLDHYVHKENCGLLLFDLYEHTMCDDGLEGTSELSRNASSDRDALRMCLATQDPRAIDLLMLRWLSVNEPATPPDSTYRPGGFAGRTDSLRVPPHYTVGVPLHLNDAQVRYFRKCLAYCQAQGIPVVLSSHYYPSASDRAQHAAFHAFVEREIAGSGIPYIDLAYAGKVNDLHHFYDDDHLNYAGVRAFNAQLLDSLAAHGMIPE